MSKIYLDKCDMLLEKLGYNFQSNLADVEIDTNVDTDSLTDLMNDLGIKRAKDDIYSLVIFNDDVNDMMHVTLALFEICELNTQEALKVMMEAHNKGKSVAKSGTFEKMNAMKIALNKRNIQATVEN